MTEQSHLATIRTYYDGCNRPDLELMESTFTPDVVHYFTNLPPVQGAGTLAHFWADFNAAWQTHFTVDHGIVEKDEAVVEWTMRCVPPGQSEPELIRGAEWYQFREGKIAEIRAYYVGHESLGYGKYELDGFPYAERGYPVLR
jgi:ketosteroid isomerase-like protein